MKAENDQNEGDLEGEKSPSEGWEEKLRFKKDCFCEQENPLFLVWIPRAFLVRNELIKEEKNWVYGWRNGKLKVRGEKIGAKNRELKDDLEVNKIWVYWNSEIS